MMDLGLARVLRVGLGIVLLVLAHPGGRAWAAADGILLAPHRAVYEMTLAASRGGSGVSAVIGRMAYEFTGSPCEGYTQSMRFVTRMTNQSGSTVVTDLRSTTWEEGSGKRFRFDSSQFRDEKATDTTAGDAARPGATDDVKVELDQARQEEHLAFATRLFPDTAHYRAAQRGQGEQGVVSRRPLRRLGEGREGL